MEFIIETSTQTLRSQRQSSSQRSRPSLLSTDFQHERHNSSRTKREQFSRVFQRILIQIWCAIGIDLTGSPSPLNDTSVNNETSVDQLNQQLIESFHQMVDEQCLKLSSLVWIAAKSNEKAMITIIDSNKAEKIIDTFTLGNAIVYAMGSVPGKKSKEKLDIFHQVFASQDRREVITHRSMIPSGLCSKQIRRLQVVNKTIDLCRL